MKKTIQLFFLAFLSFATVSAFAQPPGGGPGRGGRDVNPEQRAERQATLMQEKLELDENLTAEVKEVLLVYTKKMKDARDEAGEDRSAMRTTMQTLRTEQNEELQAILGEEQWTKWEAVVAETSGNREGRTRGGKGKGKKKDTKTE